MGFIVFSQAQFRPSVGRFFINPMRRDDPIHPYLDDRWEDTKQECPKCGQMLDNWDKCPICDKEEINLPESLHNLKEQYKRRHKCI